MKRISHSFVSCAIACLLLLFFVLVRLPTAEASGVYAENFDEKLPTIQLDGWERHDEPLAEGKPSLWVFKNFAERTAIAQISNIYGQGLQHRGTWITKKDQVWRDGSLEVLLTCTDDDVIGLLFRYVDAQNFYVLDMTDQKRFPWDDRPESRWVRLRKCLDGNYTLLGLLEDVRTYRGNDGKWHTVRIDMQGSDFQMFFDGGLLMEATDPEQPILEGTIGLAAWAQSSVLFDDLRFDALLVDDFDRDVHAIAPTGWTVYQEPGCREGPAHWQVDRVGDELALVQHSNAYKSSKACRGTWIVLEDHSWGRMTLDWDMYHTDDDIVGVLFHYQDTENFLTLEMSLQPRAPDEGVDKCPWIRLRKCVSGEYSLLGWTDQGVYQEHIWQHGQIEVKSDQIRVWLDDALVLEAVDSEPSLTRGTIGFSTYAHQWAAFDNVRVIGPMAVSGDQHLKRVWGEVKEAQDSP